MYQSLQSIRTNEMNYYRSKAQVAGLKKGASLYRNGMRQKISIDYVLSNT